MVHSKNRGSIEVCRQRCSRLCYAFYCITSSAAVLSFSISRFPLFLIGNASQMRYPQGMHSGSNFSAQVARISVSNASCLAVLFSSNTKCAIGISKSPLSSPTTLHSGVLQNHIFDIKTIAFNSTAVCKKVCSSSKDMDKSIFIHISDIACSSPNSPFRISPKEFGSSRWVLKILFHMCRRNHS